MAGRKRGTVQVRGKSVSVVIDEGEHPWRRCPTPRCAGSVFTDKVGELACERCGAPLEASVPHRKRVWTSGYKNVTEAKKALTQMLGDIDKGTFIEPSAQTLRSFVEDVWLPGLEVSRLRESTVEMYRRSAMHYVLPRLGSLRLRDVTVARLKPWLDGLKRDGTGARTLEIAYVTCHKILKAAVARRAAGAQPHGQARTSGSVAESG